MALNRTAKAVRDALKVPYTMALAYVRENKLRIEAKAKEQGTRFTDAAILMGRRELARRQ